MSNDGMDIKTKQHGQKLQIRRQNVSVYICLVVWPGRTSLSAATTLSTWPPTDMSWMALPSRRSHSVKTLSESDNRKGSKAAITEPEMFHLLPAWWLLSCSKLIVVKPGKRKKKKKKAKTHLTGLYCWNIRSQSKIQSNSVYVGKLGLIHHLA